MKKCAIPACINGIDDDALRRSRTAAAAAHTRCMACLQPLRVATGLQQQQCFRVTTPLRGHTYNADAFYRLGKQVHTIAALLRIAAHAN
jgi:hypothetical protein